jgi:hypothetical protein
VLTSETNHLIRAVQDSTHVKNHANHTGETPPWKTNRKTGTKISQNSIYRSYHNNNINWLICQLFSYFLVEFNCIEAESIKGK